LMDVLHAHSAGSDIATSSRRCRPGHRLREDALGDRAGVQTATQQRLVRLGHNNAALHAWKWRTLMAARETFAQREKRELDLQLDEELEGTFPASDPLRLLAFPPNPAALRTEHRRTLLYRRTILAFS
jgi:hypothetical protein